MGYIELEKSIDAHTGPLKKARAGKIDNPYKFLEDTEKALDNDYGKLVSSGFDVKVKNKLRGKILSGVERLRILALKYTPERTGDRETYEEMATRLALKSEELAKMDK